MQYDLGDMKSESGASLRYEVEETAATLSYKICNLIQSYPAYDQLVRELKSSKVLNYFRRIVKAEVYDAAVELAVLRWYLRNNKPLTLEQKTIRVPKNGLNLLLEKVWDDKEIVLRFRKITFKENMAFAKEKALDHLRQLAGVFLYVKGKAYFDKLKQKHPMIALEYSEGLDPDQKSDFVWFPKSGIDPQNVLVYFFDRTNVPGISQDIESRGMKWVSLRPKAVNGQTTPVWYPEIDRLPVKKAKGPVEKWLSLKSVGLLKSVAYWEAFYRQFNIKLNFAVGEGMPRHIAQSIAFDKMGKKGGFLLGKQRSEMYLTPLATFGHYDKDMFFTWSRRYNNYLIPYNNVDVNVVCGYGHDEVIKAKLSAPKKTRGRLQKNGAAFVFSLFDNMHGKEKHFSSNMVEAFYRSFFNWVIEDPTVGLIIKSKKPQVLAGLPDILPLLEKAEKTGRCIRLGNEAGRLPIDASRESDMAIGIGISSAVIESVIAGCRGIHCDLTNLNHHEFYKWGKDKIIFNDLDKMIAALKKYKEDPNADPDLGNWDKHLDQLDPFRDGRAGERMGSYMRWLLEGFEAGLGRKEVLDRANGNYAAAWGKDKIIRLEGADHV